MAEEERESTGDEMSIPIPKIINFLSTLLQRVSESNDEKQKQRGESYEEDEEEETSKSSASSSSSSLSCFHGLSRPSISIHSYLQRIFKYANCSPSCFVVAYVYLDRFVSRRNPHFNFPINSFNVHRLLITSVLVSAKFLDDMYYNNAYYAKVGGISTIEMNILEVDFLFGLGFKLNVTPNTFHTYCSFLQREMQLQEANLEIKRPIKLHYSFNNESGESFQHKQLTAV